MVTVSAPVTPKGRGGFLSPKGAHPPVISAPSRVLSASTQQDQNGIPVTAVAGAATNQSHMNTNNGAHMVGFPHESTLTDTGATAVLRRQSGFVFACFR
jgi:hypothetical protein